MQNFSLDFDAISLTRGTCAIVADLSLHTSNGDFLWIKGANGIGKSSLLRLAAGLLRPDTGTVNWTREGQPAVAADISGYQGHNDPLKPSLTVQENLSFWAEPISREDQIGAALSAVGASALAQQSAGSLSAGQSRRVALAKMLIEDKPLWIMDEPAAAMDSGGVDIIYSLIARHLEQGGGVIMASHAAPQALSERARLLQLGAPA